VFWTTYQPFLHSRNSKQANDITLIEKDTVLYEIHRIAELFNDNFVRIVGKVEEHDSRKDFENHPSIKAILVKQIKIVLVFILQIRRK